MAHHSERATDGRSAAGTHGTYVRTYVPDSIDGAQAHKSYSVRSKTIPGKKLNKFWRALGTIAPAELDLASVSSVDESCETSISKYVKRGGNKEGGRGSL